jgi:membrane fusion protein, copper/silver efflux system
MKKHASILPLFILMLVFGACSKPEQGASAKDDIDYYTCTMHPWVHSKKPGKCPVCGMDLVPVLKNKSQPDQAGQKPGTGPSPRTVTESHDFDVPIERQQQFGVTYAEAKRQRIVHTVRTVGLVTEDKGKKWVYVPRTDGYVQRLYVTSPGQVVEKGQDLLQVYSPDLATSEQELIRIVESRDHSGVGAAREIDQLIQSAKRRLRQWNLTDQQIDEIEKNRTASEFLTLVSPFRGIVEDVTVDQGEKFSPGQKLISVADLSSVWIWADFYQDEVSTINIGQTVLITAGPDRSYTGVISLVNPFVSETERTTKVRIDLLNPELRLRPGMYVNADLSVDLGEGVTVPINSVVPTGSRNFVFLDRGNGKLQPRSVQLGSQAGETYQVLSGLKEGDRVVASANFLIDAESQVQGALQGFEQESTTPSPEKTGLRNSLGAISKEPFDALLNDYSTIRAQLTNDKADLIRDSINDFDSDIHAIAGANFNLGSQQSMFMEELKELDEATEPAFRANDLETARIQFGKISEALIKLLSDYHPALTQEWKVMLCSKWRKSPAQWLQTGSEIHNPFIGTAGSDCGQTIGLIGATNLKALR